MPDAEKPYRVYKGGRVKGSVPSVPKLPRRAQKPGAEPGDGRPPGVAQPRRPRRRRYGRRFAIALGVFLLWLTAWILASYFSFRDGVQAAEHRLPRGVRPQLASQNGLLLTHSTTILLL